MSSFPSGCFGVFDNSFLSRDLSWIVLIKYNIFTNSEFPSQRNQGNNIKLKIFTPDFPPHHPYLRFQLQQVNVLKTFLSKKALWKFLKWVNVILDQRLKAYEELGDVLLTIWLFSSRKSDKWNFPTQSFKVWRELIFGVELITKLKFPRTSGGCLR